MATNEPAADGSATDRPVSWRELAVTRSLDPARLRAEKRVQRFLDAALELMHTDSGKEFTVQEVVDRSGQSLRSFYQYFAGKHELLLALFEESVRSTAERLQELIAAEDDPIERLRLASVEYYRLCRPLPKDEPSKDRPSPALSEFAQQLLTGHPNEASQAYVPLVSLFVQVLDDAAVAGAIRPDLDHRRIAGVVLLAISFDAFSATIGGTPVRPDGGDAADELWVLLLHGIGTA
ncbi:MAG TPA: TetR/AcrR family transcriptional regulator [Acidimicrobiales bacterium]|nr:TetR/AcrR family transcriptional regulator [Acidimicrobiales bacterium]